MKGSHMAIKAILPCKVLPTLVAYIHPEKDDIIKKRFKLFAKYIAMSKMYLGLTVYMYLEQ